MQFKRQEIPVPTRVFCKLVVGDDVGPDLGGAEMVNPDSWDVAHAQELGCGDPPVARDNPVLGVDQDRADESELHDAGCDLPDLLCGMYPGVASPGVQPSRVLIFDFQTSHGVPSKN